MWDLLSSRNMSHNISVGKNLRQNRVEDCGGDASSDAEVVLPNTPEETRKHVGGVSEEQRFVPPSVPDFIDTKPKPPASTLAKPVHPCRLVRVQRPPGSNDNAGTSSYVSDNAVNNKKVHWPLRRVKCQDDAPYVGEQLDTSSEDHGSSKRGELASLGGNNNLSRSRRSRSCKQQVPSSANSTTEVEALEYGAGCGAGESDELKNFQKNALRKSQKNAASAMVTQGIGNEDKKESGPAKAGTRQQKKSKAQKLVHHSEAKNMVDGSSVGKMESRDSHGMPKRQRSRKDSPRPANKSKNGDESSQSVMNHSSSAVGNSTKAPLGVGFCPTLRRKKISPNCLRQRDSSKHNDNAVSEKKVAYPLQYIWNLPRKKVAPMVVKQATDSGTLISSKFVLTTLPPDTEVKGLYVGDISAIDSEEERSHLVRTSTEGGKGVWKWARRVVAADHRRELNKRNEKKSMFPNIAHQTEEEKNHTRRAVKIPPEFIQGEPRFVEMVCKQEKGSMGRASKKKKRSRKKLAAFEDGLCSPQGCDAKTHSISIGQHAGYLRKLVPHPPVRSESPQRPRQCSERPKAERYPKTPQILPNDHEAADKEPSWTESQKHQGAQNPVPAVSSNSTKFETKHDVVCSGDSDFAIASSGPEDSWNLDSDWDMDMDISDSKLAKLQRENDALIKKLSLDKSLRTQQCNQSPEQKISVLVNETPCMDNKLTKPSAELSNMNKSKQPSCEMLRETRQCTTSDIGLQPGPVIDEAPKKTPAKYVDPLCPRSKHFRPMYPSQPRPVHKPMIPPRRHLRTIDPSDPCYTIPHSSHHRSTSNNNQNLYPTKMAPPKASKPISRISANYQRRLNNCTVAEPIGYGYELGIRRKNQWKPPEGYGENDDIAGKPDQCHQ